ncbi:AMP-binding protein [Kwoniella heveanensis CBS 569]|uniref:AMP-binding protein n=1 Tax=Kwoniella heveanensis BCC8398 TaxID=1296120 RepID=A0A1B9H1K5_9TREE|nr:AMP-binding protein [Kwoniella heveanensis BCC8398]OCF46029.1 AMP-binding protein [Kwoniella heveanensis CBS 569]
MRPLLTRYIPALNSSLLPSSSSASASCSRAPQFLRPFASSSRTSSTASEIPLPNGYTYYPNHNDTPFDMSKESTLPSPRPDQIYVSSTPAPHLPRMSVYHYLFPFKRYKSKHRTRFLYYPDPNLDKPSFIDGLTGRFVTRGQVEEQAKKLATGLKRKGIQRGEVGCIFGMNSLEWVNACFGSQALGAIVSPANYAYTPDELLHQLRDSTASFAFVQPSLLPVFLKALELDPKYTIAEDRIILLCSKAEKAALAENHEGSGGVKAEWLEKFPCTEEIWDTPGTPARLQDGMEERTAYLCYSSGTTGRGKGVETSHHNITSQIQAFNCSYEPIKYKDVILAMLPFSHIYGLTVTLHQPLTVNGTVVILPKFEEASVLKAIERFKVTWALVVPPMLIALLHSPNVAKHDISTIRGFMSGAAPLSSDLIHAFERKYPHIKVTQGYGLTETSPVSHVMTLEESKGHDGHIGRVLPTYQARLVDQESGKDVEKGQRGELWLRGPSVMKGYWRNQEATSGVFALGGWFKTGDVATVDNNGYFSIVDRVKELIKYKGFQVPPAELEALLLTHPEVTDVGVIGIYSKAEATELPRAYVVPAGGLASLPTTEAKQEFSEKIVKWVSDKVANHKRLRGGVILLDVVPKSPSGKILRKDLRARAVKEEEEGVIQGRRAKL